MMDTLEDKWQNLSLSDAESNEITLIENEILEDVKRGDLCLVGEIHYDRIIKKLVI